jgi:hypothetical protein
MSACWGLRDWEISTITMEEERINAVLYSLLATKRLINRRITADMHLFQEIEAL